MTFATHPRPPALTVPIHPTIKGGRWFPMPVDLLHLNQRNREMRLRRPRCRCLIDVILDLDVTHRLGWRSLDILDDSAHLV
jgi:hypothetical protein